jgi:hypothetical protein
MSFKRRAPAATRLLCRKIAGDYSGKDGRNEPRRRFSGRTKPNLIGQGL